MSSLVWRDFHSFFLLQKYSFHTQKYFLRIFPIKTLSIIIKKILENFGSGQAHTYHQVSLILVLFSNSDKFLFGYSSVKELHLL
ncbi:unnamed protein product [Meloidogyne enterolobii]|uniref:Uncharacterized protein n=1 Tax=Meloidogyne enterolobii TaxID=390850 RepID=A0ACB1ADA8_MELEN